MPQEMTEGKTTFRTDSTHKIDADMPVFYNPVMKLNRDLTLLALPAMNAWMRAPIRIALPMEASGIRAARILREVVAPGLVSPAKIFVNDLSKEAIAFARENVERNIGGYPAENIQFSIGDASAFLRSLNGAEYVDIDPFGTPNPFLDAAVRCVTRGGLLAVTATDTSALAGTYPRASARKYWSVPSRTWGMHEWGLRILIRKVQLVAAQYERALVPVLSLATDHYYRIFFRLVGGNADVQKVLSQHGLVRVDTAAHTALPTTQTAGATGPLWMGPLHDAAFVTGMIAEAERDPALFKEALGILRMVAEETRVHALGFIDLHELSSMLGIQCPPRDAVLEKLGESAARTHLCPFGLVTRLPIETVIETVRALAPERK